MTNPASFDPDFDADLAIPDPDAETETKGKEPEVEAPQYRRESVETATTAPASDETGEGTGPKLEYPNVGAWVDDWLLPRFRRELGGSKRRWDPQWWRYEESGGALEALWQAWEHLRLQPGTGIAVFYRDYFYPLMDQITAPDGPFWNYRGGYPSVPGNTKPDPWESAAAPQGWFREEGDPREQ